MLQHDNFFFRESSSGGLLLMDADFAPLHANREAVEILTYPENARNIQPLDDFLTGKIRSLVQIESRSLKRVFASEIVSGRRRYHCRTFCLNAGGQDALTPIFAILIERPAQLSLDTASVAQKFRLTARERETMEFLLQGFTSKEIAARMCISPNTVKAFIKLIMMKTGTSTRSAIVGKILPLPTRNPHSTTV